MTYGNWLATNDISICHWSSVNSHVSFKQPRYVADSHRKGPMPRWISALVIAILVVVIPFTFIIRLMLQLPKPVALSHRRWPLAVNFGVIAAITAYTTIFIRSVYYGRATNPISILMEFVIAAL